MGEVANKLTHNDMPCIDDEAIRYFRDVLDHIRRVETTVGVLREVLTSVFEASNLLEQQRTGASTRQLAAWAAILAVPTAIAGADRRDLPGALPPVGRRDRRRPQPGAPPPTITLSWNRSPVIRAPADDGLPLRETEDKSDEHLSCVIGVVAVLRQRNRCGRLDRRPVSCLWSIVRSWRYQRSAEC